MRRRRLTRAQRILLLTKAGIFPAEFGGADCSILRGNDGKPALVAWRFKPFSIEGDHELTDYGKKRVDRILKSWAAAGITVEQAQEAYRLSRKRGGPKFSRAVEENNFRPITE